MSWLACCRSNHLLPASIAFHCFSNHTLVDACHRSLGFSSTSQSWQMSALHKSSHFSLFLVIYEQNFSGYCVASCKNSKTLYCARLLHGTPISWCPLFIAMNCARYKNTKQSYNRHVNGRKHLDAQHAILCFPIPDNSCTSKWPNNALNAPVQPC